MANKAAEHANKDKKIENEVDSKCPNTHPCDMCYIRHMDYKGIPIDKSIDTIVDELNTMAVRIDTNRLKRDWYLDPYRFEIEWTSEDGYWSHHNLHQYVCVEGRVPPEVLDFYAYSLERERPELQILENNGVTHVVAEPYGQEFVSVDKYVLYLKKLNSLEDLKLCA